MFGIETTPVPDTALLGKYQKKSVPENLQAYADCYSVEVGGVVTLSDFVFAFYTTPVFKLERIILKYLAGKASTDSEARQLANASINAFAAWNVEQRTQEQLLMSDFRGRTRSWFMVTPAANTRDPRTTLWFGSAVVPIKNRKTGNQELGRAFTFLLGFHKLYSKTLLYVARSRIEKTQT
ncbi:MAG: hypothetical protein ACR2PZ_26430 [Pseudomonadales bacterium]